MILDTSAVVAILRGEPEAAIFSREIEKAGVVRISAVNYVETAAVVERRFDPIPGNDLDRWMLASATLIEAVSVEQARVARAAYRDFGRGSGHPAQLNLGDCFSYALARMRREPLLFKGEDLARTDVTPAL